MALSMRHTILSKRLTSDLTKILRCWASSLADHKEGQSNCSQTVDCVHHSHQNGDSTGHVHSLHDIGIIKGSNFDCKCVLCELGSHSTAQLTISSNEKDSNFVDSDMGDKPKVLLQASQIAIALYLDGTSTHESPQQVTLCYMLYVCMNGM